MLSKIARKRLEDMIYALDQIKNPRWFDLNEWATEGFSKKKCGTTGCAVGWYCTIFPKRKLKLKEKVYPPAYQVEDNVNSRGSFMTVTDRILSGFPAVKRYFNLSMQDSEYLFLKDSYPKGRCGPKSVKNRIKDFLRKDGNVEYTLYEGL